MTNSITTQQSSNVQSQTLPVIAGHEIPMDEHGRFNLNAIHRASGGKKGKEPSFWTTTKQAQELIEEAGALLAEQQTKDSWFEPLKSRRGGKAPGTFAVDVIAVSYAGWISPRFQLQVNQVFLDYRMGKLDKAASSDSAEPKSLPRPTVQDRAPLKQLVNAIVDARSAAGQPSDYSTAWRQVNAYIGVAKIEEASFEQIEEGIGFAKRVLEGELVEQTPALPQSGLNEEERHDLFLMGTHIGWALRYWTDYQVESSLSALGSPAGTRIGEHLKVAGLYGRRILREHAELMSVSKSRLGLDHLASL